MQRLEITEEVNHAARSSMARATANHRATRAEWIDQATITGVYDGVGNNRIAPLFVLLIGDSGSVFVPAF